MNVKLDVLIKNANVIDPRKGTIEIGNIAISNGKIVDYDSDKQYTIQNEINADGYYVSPGWIESHIHIFKDGTESGLAPDVSLIPMGITTAIDAGSSGYGNWNVFKKHIVDESILNIYYSINVSPAGQITERYPENVDPANYDEGKFADILNKDPNHARGLKLRYGAEVVENYGNDVLDKSIKLADKLNCPLTVHVTNPPCPMEEIVAKMRPGDIVCHIYQGKRSTILDENKMVKSAVFEARKRGVYFDSADARPNHSYPVIRAAIEQNFKPDIISTDLTQASMFGNMCWGLPVVLSKWMNLGLSLEEVIKCCTYNPAKIHHLMNGLGTLDIGADANITIFKVIDHKFHLTNKLGEHFDGTKLIVPLVTVVNGVVRYQNVEFPF